MAAPLPPATLFFYKMPVTIVTPTAVSNIARIAGPTPIRRRGGWTNRGKYRRLKQLFDGSTLPTNFYVALVTADIIPNADTNMLGDLTEIAAGNGYTSGGISLSKNTTDFPTVSESDTKDRGNIDIKDVTFTASGGQIPASGNGARYAVLTDDNASVIDREVYYWWHLGNTQILSTGSSLTLRPTISVRERTALEEFSNEVHPLYVFQVDSEDNQKPPTLETRVSMRFAASGAQYLTIPDDPSLNHDGKITLCAWVQPNTSGTFRAIIGKDNDSNQREYKLFLDTSNRLNFSVSLNGTTITTVTLTSPTIAVDTWHFVAGRFTGTSLEVFHGADGGTSLTSASTALSGSIFLGTSLIWIGRDNTGPRYFEGVIDHIYLYGTNLTTSQLLFLYNSGKGRFYTDTLNNPDSNNPGTTNAQAILPLMESGPGNRTDFSGQDNHAIASTQSTATEGGFVGGSAQNEDRASTGNGSTQYAKTLDIPSLSYPFSVEAWVRTTDVSNGTIWAYSDTDTANTLLLRWLQASNTFAAFVDNGTSSATALGSGTGHNDNEWHHVVAIFTSATSRRVYVDGTSGTVNTTNVSFPTGIDNQTAWVLHRSSTLSDYLLGSLDELRIYNKALSSSEVLGLYDGGAGVLTDEMPATLPNLYPSLIHGYPFSNRRNNDASTDSIGGKDFDNVFSVTDIGGIPSGQAANPLIRQAFTVGGRRRGNFLLNLETAFRPFVQSNIFEDTGALVFDGVNDSLSMTGSTIEPPTAQPDLIFITVKFDSLTGTQNIFDGMHVTNRYNFRKNSSHQIEFGISSFITGSVVDTNWHVFGILINGTSSKIYKDGVLDASGTIGSATIVPTGFVIGASQSSTNFFKGKITDFWLHREQATQNIFNRIGNYLAGRVGVTWTNASF